MSIYFAVHLMTDSTAYWCRPIIPVIQKAKEDPKFKAHLGYKAHSSLAWVA